MKVLLDLRAVHEGMTGIGRYALNLCLSLEAVGDPLLVEGITTPAGQSLLQRHGTFRLHVTRSNGPSWDDLALPDLIRSLGTNLYHSPLFVLPSVRTCKYVCTVHDVIPVVRPDLTHESFSLLFHRSVNRAFRSAHHIVTVSHHSRMDLLKSFHLDANRVSTVHEPVSPLFFREASPEDVRTIGCLGLSPGYLLSVGALDKRKNLCGLLDAYALLCRDRATPPLAVVGDASGDDFDVVAEVGRRKLESKVRLLGRVPDDVLAALYTHASVFVFPSFYEGFGLPVIEAMAAGAPVVASNASSLPEVAGEAALLVDPGKPESIMKAMRRILDEVEFRQELVVRGKARAAQYTLKNHGEALTRLYRRVLEEAA
jgi:glycosyltransferase involved in cell wall biosynthesis